MSAGNNLPRRLRDPDLTNLRGLSRAEAMRIAMIRYGWDAATAAKRVDAEQGHYSEESLEPNKRQSA